MGPDLTTTDTVAVVCCALLGILLFLLGADVTRLRASRGPRDLMPTDPSDALLMAQRAHGNGAEYIPTLVILLLVCAALSDGWWVAALALASLAANVLHGTIHHACVVVENSQANDFPA